MGNYTKGNHTIYYHRYHLVWITKYCYKVLSGQIQIRMRDILGRISEELTVKIINGVISKDHIHIFCSISPYIGSAAKVSIDIKNR
ncbi:MAG: IS200/IS605 family transposase [Bacteroidetes bacterium]|nr:IS200/IS605 family transposase [Bacteroidota bacterium]